MDAKQEEKLRILGEATHILMKPGRLAKYRTRRGPPAEVRVHGKILHGKARKMMDRTWRRAVKARGGWDAWRRPRAVAEILERKAAEKRARMARRANRGR